MRLPLSTTCPLPSSSSSSSYRSFHHTRIWNCTESTPTEKNDKPDDPASTTPPSNKNNDNDNHKNNNQKKQMFFPWQPLPRNRHAPPHEHSAMGFWMDIFGGTNLVEGLSRRHGVVEQSAFVRIEKNLRALFFLNISMSQSLMESDWIADLVDSSAWGFAHAVGTVLSNMSHDVPLDQIMKTDGDSIVVDFDGKASQYVPKEMSPAIHNMLEKRLVATYYKQTAPPIPPLQPPQATEQGDDDEQQQQQQQPSLSSPPPLEPFHVQLKMKVLGGRLIGFDMIEFVTRAMAEEDPTQKTFLKEAHQAYQSSVLAYYRTLENLGLYQMQLRGASSVSFTIIMEVMVDCEEIFTVTDSNGNVVQGMTPPPLPSPTTTTSENENAETALYQPTSHLVRLENVVDFDVVQRTFQLGSWTITDWDDLLEGNMWLEA